MRIVERDAGIEVGLQTGSADGFYLRLPLHTLKEMLIRLSHRPVVFPDCFQGGSVRRSIPVQHIPTAAHFTALDDQIGCGPGAAKQNHARVPILRRQSNLRRLAVIHRTLQHIPFAHAACTIAATTRQGVAVSCRSFEDGFASFGDKGEVVRLERDTESHGIF